MTAGAELKQHVIHGWYQFVAFEEWNVIAAFSTRRFHLAFDRAWSDSVVIEERKRFCQLTGVPFEGLVGLEQIHGANIARLSGEDRGRGARSQKEVIGGTDGALTNSPEVVLSVRTADCAPVFFLDPVQDAIGMAHIGWRGARAGLASKMVQAFRHQFMTRPEDLVVAIGPAIRRCCYQVGSDLKRTFRSFVTKRRQSYYFDLVGWILDALCREGVQEDQVYDSQLCTLCLNERFPSYRREGPSVDPMLSVLWRASCKQKI